MVLFQDKTTANVKKLIYINIIYFHLKNYGINLIDQEGKMIIDTIDWKGLAKKDGIEMGDIITEFKIENLDRPNKGIVYPFALLFLIIIGFLNYKRKTGL